MRARKLVLMATLVFAMVLGLAFVESAAAANKTYNLYATDGYISMADGTVVYIYGFVGGEAGKPLTFQNSMKAKKPTVPGGITTLPGGAPNPSGGPMTAAEAPLFGNAQFPAPLIYCSVGDVVEIRLKNLGVSNGAAPNDPHTIHLHGLDVNAANDGVPETSVAAVPANAAKTVGTGNVVVYMFAPDHAGTYMYHCHQEADIHVQMGMYGALVVYNQTDAAAATGPGAGQGGSLHGWAYDKDYVLLESEFDIGQHVAEEFAGARGAYNPVNYKPQYWFINGLSFPNTIHAGPPPFNWANWIASHPGYDPLYTGSVSKPSADGTLGEKVLLRVINMGFETQPMHMHGYHGKILGSDQRAWPWANTAGVTPWNAGMEKNTLTVGSGETYEWLVNFGLQNLNGTYDYATNGAGPATWVDPVTGLAGTQTRYKPLTLAPIANTATDPATGLFYPAIPDPFTPPFTYIGGPTVGPVLANGVSTQNDNTEVGAVATGIGLTNFNGQFFPFHNHDDYKATNNGVYPGGMFTMLVTTP